jgi:hypothetical protein
VTSQSSPGRGLFANAGAGPRPAVSPRTCAEDTGTGSEPDLAAIATTSDCHYKGCWTARPPTRTAVVAFGRGR